jgi:hypothetical protein
MSDTLTRLRDEIEKLAADQMAVENLLGRIFTNMIKSGLVPNDLIEKSFNEADLFGEATAIGAKTGVTPGHTARQLETIRDLRGLWMGR